MTATSAKLLLWSPRVLGVIVCVFLSLFALDAFTDDRTFVDALPDFAIHVAPTMLLLAIVAASWRWAWLGGFTFIVLSGVYVWIAGGRLDWIIVVSGPLLSVGVLFLWSWRSRNQLHIAH